MTFRVTSTDFLLRTFPVQVLPYAHYLGTLIGYSKVCNHYSIHNKRIYECPRCRSKINDIEQSCVWAIRFADFHLLILTYIQLFYLSNSSNLEFLLINSGTIAFISFTISVISTSRERCSSWSAVACASV